jgi:uncharacterized protein
LPYGTTDVPLTEDHDPRTVEEALVLGAQLWGEQRYFEAHECLEHVWHAAPEDDRDLWQGVIQLAVTAVHVQRGNRVGALAMLDRVEARLGRYPDEHRGVDVAGALATAARMGAQLRADEPVDLPGFPATPSGAWFTPDSGVLEPPAAPTPVPEEPAWVAAGQRRQARRRP